MSGPMHYDLPISQILRHELLECLPTTPVAEAAGRMYQAHCGSILVVAAIHALLGLAEARQLQALQG